MPTEASHGLMRAFANDFGTEDVGVIGGDMGEKTIFPGCTIYNLPFDITKETLPLKHKIVVCSDVFEHLYDPVRAAENIVKSMPAKGMLLFSAPSIWPYHEYPVDCYRFTDTVVQWLFRDLTEHKCWVMEENEVCHRVVYIGEKV